jgi:two-component system nitrogen regulation response regulator GlnG
MPHLLVVDDEQSICWALARLAKELGHSVATAASAEQGLQEARARRPDLVVLDVRLPGMDGITAVGKFHETAGPVPIIVITAYGELETAVAAVRSGAFEYLVKPFDLEVAQRAIERALAAPMTTDQATPLRPRDASPWQLVGKSPAMQEVFKKIALVAPADACVHLRGESGVGKELVARAIHRYSARAAGPFLPVNLASLSPSLAESELFGHERGAFTGADQARKGFLEQAAGGTIFLDEVGEVPAPLQVKLLRSLEHKEIWPIGATGPRRTDFRIISATNQDLRRHVAAGEFRHDLYHRLITFEIEIPPLRERPEDVAELVQYFLDDFAARAGRPCPVVAAPALAELERRPWYGNVRELRNALEHALILARGGEISVEHLPPPAPRSAEGMTDEHALLRHVRTWAEAQLARGGESSDLYARLLRLVEPPLLESALRQHHGQCAAAARTLGLHRTTLRKKLDEYGLGGS